MSEFTMDRLRENLESLKMKNTLEILDNYLERAVAENLNIVDVLDHIFSEEAKSKRRRAYEKQIQMSGFPIKKTLDDFDFSFQPSIDKRQIDELATMRFLENGENVVFLGPPGVGKTHLASALGLVAAQHRFSTYYVNCHQLIEQLKKAHFENRLPDKLKVLAKYRMLIIDEIGYLPMDIQGANLFFQLMSLNGKYGDYGGYGNYKNYGNYSGYGVSGNAFSQVLQNVSSAKTWGGMKTPMDEIFEEAARETGVDIRLLKAVGKAESGFRESATSRCGAMGVMQLMPGTAKSLGVTDAYDARQNIMGGARYLAKLLKKYDGDTELALAAYNAGSGNVAKYGGIPPFKETQNYVKRVLEYAGEDFNAGQAMVSGENAVSPLVSEVSAQPSADPAVSDIGYTDLCKMMVQMMQLEMQQKLQSILGADTDDNGMSGTVL